MLMKIAGRLVRLDHIVEVTADNTMQLSTGTVIPLTAADAPVVQGLLVQYYGLYATVNAEPAPSPSSTTAQEN